MIVLVLVLLVQKIKSKSMPITKVSFSDDGCITRVRAYILVRKQSTQKAVAERTSHTQIAQPKKKAENIAGQTGQKLTLLVY